LGVRVPLIHLVELSTAVTRRGRRQAGIRELAQRRLGVVASSAHRGGWNAPLRAGAFPSARRGGIGDVVERKAREKFESIDVGEKIREGILEAIRKQGIETPEVIVDGKKRLFFSILDPAFERLDAQYMVSGGSSVVLILNTDRVP
jgi:hypothetical protein